MTRFLIINRLCASCVVCRAVAISTTPRTIHSIACKTIVDRIWDKLFPGGGSLSQHIIAQLDKAKAEHPAASQALLAALRAAKQPRQKTAVQRLACLNAMSKDASPLRSASISCLLVAAVFQIRISLQMVNTGGALGDSVEFVPQIVEGNALVVGSLLFVQLF